MIGPFGRIYLGPTGAEIQFTADPTDYKPWQWKKRMSKHPGIGGSMTIQDFGTTYKDATIEIEASIEGLMDNATVANMHGYFRTKGATYRFYDWLGNDFTVFVEDFVPVAHTQLPGSAYSMRLTIVGVTKLFGSAYAGS